MIRVMRTAALPLLVGLLTAAFVIGHVSSAPRAEAASAADLAPHEARLYQLINEARAANGVVTLGVAGGAVDVARNWSSSMARTGTFRHNPDYVAQLRSAGSSNATAFSENVAYGYANPDAMFQAYMNSPGHRANILAPGMRLVGIGSVRNSSGTWYNTMNFVNAETGGYGPPRVPGDGMPQYTMLLLRNSASPGSPDVGTFTYGSAANQTLACDVTGDGRDDLISYRDGFWSIRYSVNGGQANASFQYGFAGAIPVCGNWDGRDGAGIGVYANGTWYLRNAANAGYPDALFNYGGGGYLPVVGDWNGDGVDSIGVVDPRSYTWLVRNGNSLGEWDAGWQYGFAGAVPMPGNFAGSRTTELGLFHNGTWYVRESLGPGAARAFGYGGSGYGAVVADWNADGIDGIGVTRPA